MQDFLAEMVELGHPWSPWGDDGGGDGDDGDGDGDNDDVQCP